MSYLTTPGNTCNLHNVSLAFHKTKGFTFAVKKTRVFGVPYVFFPLWTVWHFYIIQQDSKSTSECAKLIIYYFTHCLHLIKIRTCCLHSIIFRFLLRKLFALLFTTPLDWNRRLRLHQVPVALSIHLTSRCQSLSKQSKPSMSNINIWSQSSSCLSKYNQGEEKVSPSEASCCVYYFSVWPLTYRQKRDSCLWKQQTFCFDCWYVHKHHHILKMEGKSVLIFVFLPYFAS